MKRSLLPAAAVLVLVFLVSSYGGYESAEATSDYTVAAGNQNGVVYVYDGSGTLLWSYDTGATVASVAVSADGEYIAVGSLGNKLYLFDRSGVKLWEKAVPVSAGGHGNGVESKSVQISADGEYVVAGTTGSLRVYKKDGTLHWSHAGAETSVGISPDATYVVSAEKYVGVDFFSIASSTPLWSTGDINAFWVATSDPGYVAVGKVGDRVHLYDSGGTEIWSYSHSKWVGSDYIRVDMAEDGLSVVGVNDEPGDTTGCALAYWNHLQDGTPGWSPPDGTPSWTYIPTPDVGTNDQYTVAISADGGVIGAGPHQGTVVLSSSGAELQKFTANTMSIDLTSDGEFGVYGVSNGQVAFFSKNSGLLWAKMTGAPGVPVRTVAVGGGLTPTPTPTPPPPTPTPPPPTPTPPPPTPTPTPGPGIGGTTELLTDGPDAATTGGDGSGPSAPLYGAIAGAAAMAATALAAGGWYARRRFRQKRI